MLPSACASDWTCDIFLLCSFVFLSSLFFSPGLMCVAWRCSSWVISVVVWLSGRLCVHDVLWSRSAASIILIAPGPHPLVYLASHYASVSRQYSRLATRVSSPPSSLLPPSPAPPPPLRLPTPYLSPPHPLRFASIVRLADPRLRPCLPTSLIARRPPVILDTYGPSPPDPASCAPPRTRRVARRTVPVRDMLYHTESAY